MISRAKVKFANVLSLYLNRIISFYNQPAASDPYLRIKSSKRPANSRTLKPGQESVWDYPRPPRVESTSKRIRVVYAGETIADTQRAFRVLETSHPPVY